MKLLLENWREYLTEQGELPGAMEAQGQATEQAAQAAAQQRAAQEEQETIAWIQSIVGPMPNIIDAITKLKRAGASGEQRAKAAVSKMAATLHGVAGNEMDIGVAGQRMGAIVNDAMKDVQKLPQG